MITKQKLIRGLRKRAKQREDAGDTTNWRPAAVPLSAEKTRPVVDIDWNKMQRDMVRAEYNRTGKVSPVYIPQRHHYFNYMNPAWVRDYRRNYGWTNSTGKYYQSKSDSFVRRSKFTENWRKMRPDVVAAYDHHEAKKREDPSMLQRGWQWLYSRYQRLPKLFQFNISGQGPDTSATLPQGDLTQHAPGWDPIIDQSTINARRLEAAGTREYPEIEDMRRAVFFYNMYAESAREKGKSVRPPAEWMESWLKENAVNPKVKDRINKGEYPKPWATAFWLKTREDYGDYNPEAYKLLGDYYEDRDPVKYRIYRNSRRLTHTGRGVLNAITTMPLDMLNWSHLLLSVPKDALFTEKSWGDALRDRWKEHRETSNAIGEVGYAISDKVIPQLGVFGYTHMHDDDGYPLSPSERVTDASMPGVGGALFSGLFINPKYIPLKILDGLADYGEIGGLVYDLWQANKGLYDYGKVPWGDNTPMYMKKGYINTANKQDKPDDSKSKSVDSKNKSTESFDLDKLIN